MTRLFERPLCGWFLHDSGRLADAQHFHLDDVPADGIGQLHRVREEVTPDTNRSVGRMALLAESSAVPKAIRKGSGGRGRWARSGRRRIPAGAANDERDHRDQRDGGDPADDDAGPRPEAAGPPVAGRAMRRPVRRRQRLRIGLARRSDGAHLHRDCTPWQRLRLPTCHDASSSSTNPTSSSSARSAGGQPCLPSPGRKGGAVVSVALEKTQVAALATRLDELLDAVARIPLRPTASRRSRSSNR